MYVSVAVTIVFTTTINSLITMYIRGVMKKLEKACENRGSVIVLRSNESGVTEQMIGCSMVFPGDIVYLRRETILPFDCVILEGSC